LKISRHHLSVAVSSVVAVVFIWISFVTTDWAWFARSGSVIIIVAIVTEYLPNLREGSVQNTRFWPQQEDHSSMRVAAYLVMIGTVIWGFGDLVGKLV